MHQINRLIETGNSSKWVRAICLILISAHAATAVMLGWRLELCAPVAIPGGIISHVRSTTEATQKADEL